MEGQKHGASPSIATRGRGGPWKEAVPPARGGFTLPPRTQRWKNSLILLGCSIPPGTALGDVPRPVSDLPRPTARPNPSRSPAMAMHYPRRVSKIKRVRMFGFRARMRTKAGRKLINRKRAIGRRITPSM